jgi:hypothetical protein
MRLGELNLKGLLPHQIETVMSDIDYYQLPQPKVSICWDVQSSSNRVQFSNNNLTVTKTNGGEGWNCAVIASAPSTKFSVRMDRLSSKNVMIGFVDKSQFKSGAGNYASTGYMFYALTGNTYTKGTSIGYLHPLKEGDEVTAVFDKNSRKISFFINNGQPPTTQINVSETGDMFPVLDVSDQNGSVTLTSTK